MSKNNVLNPTLKLLKSEKDYLSTLDRIEEIFDAEIGTPEGDELELLSLIVKTYEDEHYPIPDPDPIEKLRDYIQSKNREGMLFEHCVKDMLKIIDER